MEEREENNFGGGNICAEKGNLWNGGMLRGRAGSPRGSWEVEGLG